MQNENTQGISYKFIIFEINVINTEIVICNVNTMKMFLNDNKQIVIE